MKEEKYSTHLSITKIIGESTLENTARKGLQTKETFSAR
jgi:hypothetical protein